MRLAFEIPFGSIANTCFSPDGNLFAAGGDVPGSRDGKVATESLVRVWSVPSGAPLAGISWNLDDGPFVFSPDSRTLAVPQSHQGLALCESTTGRIQRRLAAFGAPLFSPDGHHLALTAEDSVRVFRLSDLQEIAHRKGTFATRAFTTPQLILLHAWPQSLDGDLRLWNYTDGTERRLHGRQVFPTASTDGQVMGLLALGQAAGSSEIVFRDLGTGAELARLRTPEFETAGQLSPHGRHIAFASPNEPGRFLLWDSKAVVSRLASVNRDAWRRAPFVAFAISRARS